MVRNHGLAFCTRLVCCAPALFAFAQSDNVQAQVLLNAGFEGAYTAPRCTLAGAPSISGAVAPGWRDASCAPGAGTSIVYSRSSTNVRSGAAAQCVNSTAARVHLTQQFAPLAGRHYSAGVWLRSNNAAGTPMRVELALRPLSATGASYGNVVVTLGPEWTRYSVSAGGAAAPVAFTISALARGHVCMDDAELSFASELLAGVGFERRRSWTPRAASAPHR